MSRPPEDATREEWDAARAVLKIMRDEDGYFSPTVYIIRGMRAERGRIEALLKDPAAVRANYMRGGIACQHLIDEAVAAERERCAKIIEDNMLCGDDGDAERLHPRNNPGNKTGMAYAAAIRAGGQ